MIIVSTRYLKDLGFQADGIDISEAMLGQARLRDRSPAWNSDPVTGRGVSRGSRRPSAYSSCSRWARRSTFPGVTETAATYEGGPVVRHAITCSAGQLPPPGTARGAQRHPGENLLPRIPATEFLHPRLSENHTHRPPDPGFREVAWDVRPHREEHPLPGRGVSQGRHGGGTLGVTIKTSDYEQ